MASGAAKGVEMARGDEGRGSVNQGMRESMVDGD